MLKRTWPMFELGNVNEGLEEYLCADFVEVVHELLYTRVILRALKHFHSPSCRLECMYAVNLTYSDIRTVCG